MAYADQQTSGNRVVAIILVALIHVFVGYLFISGLAIEAVKKVAERVTTVDIEEPEPEEPEDEPPPPEDVPQQVPPPVAPPPPINIAPAPPPIQTRPTIPPPSPPAQVIPPPAAPAPAAPSKARGATPDGQRRWAARIQENYPSRALREEIQGTVGVSVVVGPDGRVSSCSVSRSSGSSILDEAACQGMQRYARFNPALDDAGNPTNGRYSTSITYQLN
ncbi:MAG: TonB family protein [Erythrobacter sp.]